jgi:hypothetical protein
MGIFKTEDCPICGKPTGAMSKSSAKYNGVYVCQDCAKKLSANKILLIRLKKYPLEELQKIVNAETEKKEEHEEEVKAFSATKEIGKFILFDDVNKKIAIPKTSLTGKIRDMKIFDYSSIVEFELLEDGNSIEKGGVGRAIVGGALFGGVGAVVGAATGHKHKATCSKLQIKITLNDISMPVVYVNFIEAETKKNGALYKMVYPMAQEALSVLSIITKSQEQINPSNTEGFSEADEILKFKKLLDEGIITQEEFDLKKKQLLGL